MDTAEARDLVFQCYRLAFEREPSGKEYDWFIPQLAEKRIEPVRFLESCYNSEEFRLRRGVRTVFPTGHYHSPVVDPSTVGTYLQRERDSGSGNLIGIDLNLPAMRELWLKHLQMTKENTFPKNREGDGHFGYDNGYFPEGDAVSLQIIFAEFRPSKIIEIGSGHSTACMLDVAARLGLSTLELVCIDPFPQRLNSLLRTGDQVTVIDKPVQDVPAEIADELNKNDVLFIDSTHVLKTGSDLHFELFHLLPRLRSGVIVHFHDIFRLFEYPEGWICNENLSWNEAYALRAFLMYNSEFEILYWDQALRAEKPSEMQAEFPLASGNPGASIWLKRRDRSKARVPIDILQQPPLPKRG